MHPLVSARWLKRRVNRIVDLRGIPTPAFEGGTKTLYIHVGAHKTGTTTLQELLRTNAEVLYRRGILPIARVLPLVGDMEQSQDNESDILAHLRVAVRAPHKRVGRTARSKLAATVAPYVGLTPSIVLSDEAYLGRRPGLTQKFYPQAGRFVEELARAFPGYKPKVILYIRHHDRLVESNYLHSIKLGDQRSFDQFLADTALDAMSWLSVAERIAAVVGDENLVVHPFERIQNGAVVFAKEFFSDFTTTEGLAFPEVAANPSLSQLGVQVSRVLAPRMSPEMWRIVRQLIQKGLSNRVLPSPQLMTEAQRNAMRARFAEDYAETLRRFGRASA